MVRSHRATTDVRRPAAVLAPEEHSIAVLPLLAPLNGLVRGRRHTYAWATLFAIPYLAFALTELLANPQARWVAAMTLLLVFAWFCTMILYLRASRVHRE